MTNVPQSPVEAVESEEDSEHRVGWLELFYDLVFVVLIAALAHRLHGHPHVGDFFVVAGLSLLVWVSWTNFSSLANLSDSLSRERRVLVLAAMAGVGLMGVAIPEVTGDRAGLFALGYAVVRIAIWPLWVKQLRHVGVAPVRATVFGPGLGLLWLFSIAVPAPVRWWLWAALAVAELGLLARSNRRLRYNTAHLVERVGLFVMIVLGESVVQLIQAVAEHPTPLAWLAGALAFLIICTFWWMYFDLGSTSTARYVVGRSYALIRDVLLIGHWIGILGLILLGAGVGNAIEQSADHLESGTLAALCAGVMLYHGAAALISLRWGSPVREVAIAAVPALGVPALLLAFAGGWPAWAVLVVLLAETWLHFWLGGRTVRRQLRDAERAQSLDG